MTPKEKAEELVNKFYQKVADGAYPKENAKDCALIAVDEILNVIPYNKWESEHQMTKGQYWQEVKQEINNL